MNSKLSLNFTFNECKKVAESSDFSLVPLVASFLSDSFTPVQLVRKLKRISKQCFLLESAEQDKHFGRWSILGFDPKYEILLENGNFSIKGISKQTSAYSYSTSTSNPNAELRLFLSKFKSSSFSDFPFTGGVVGVFSYDYFRYREPVLQKASLKNSDFFDLDLLFFDKVILFDHYKQTLSIVVNIDTSDKSKIEKEYKRAVKEIKFIKKIIFSSRLAYTPSLRLGSPITPVFSHDEYASIIRRAKHYIKEGDIFQVVPSNPQKAKVSGSLFDTYRILRTTNPSPYMFYFTSPQTEIAGASPETLVRLDKQTLSTFPLAGTRKRGGSDEEDEKIRLELLADEKEKAEHNMLVDLGRNDIGSVAVPGSVRVKRYMDVVKFSHVMHIASEVTGTIAPGKDALDAISSILPAGTLSGAPKIRACQIIDELEGQKRGIYGGAIGYIDFQGNLDTCIAIRLAYIKNSILTVQSGGGVVADSEIENEIREYQNKAASVIEAINKANGGIK